MSDSISTPPPAPDESAGDLFREAFDETRELVRLEVALARQELRAELEQATRAGISLGAAASLGISAFAMFMVAIAAAFPWMWLAALVIGAILALLAGGAALFGWRALPRRPLGETRDRVEADLRQLRERIA